MQVDKGEVEMNDSPKVNGEPAVLLIDGHCMLCSGITQFVIKRDPHARFRFAALQSEAGQKLLLEGNLPQDDFHTFVMVEDGQYYLKSEAALRVFRKLKGFWPLLYACRAVPVSWRNRVYDAIAYNRNRLFGRSEECLLPGPDIRARFLNGGH
ncbi:thiol-disulfide oxidoreductase DCC family protein [Paenibacillus vietnamensis]|uniref:thiol-disulfide oxidoreductase DCC family protein n=1 Tax=Paenibacillus vietnamensis TaxID=2590547 RepID=UPI0037CB87CC